MAPNIRVVLEGRFEQVERAAARWAAAAESLGAEDWDRRRQWTTLAVEDADELEAVATLQRKAAALSSREGLELLGRYRAARGSAERLLADRLKAFGGAGGVPSASVKELSTHLPLQCSRSFSNPLFLAAALVAGFGAFLLALFHPLYAVAPLAVAIPLALKSVRVHARVTVTQRVLAVNGFAVPFSALKTVTLSHVSRAGYVLVALLQDGSSHSWSFDHPLTDVVEVLGAQGVAVSACAVPHVLGAFEENRGASLIETLFVPWWMR